MSNEIDLKALWSRKATTAPSVEEIISTARRYRQKTRNKLLLGIVLLLATIAFIVLVLFFSNLHLFTTKLGVMLIIISIVMISSYSLFLFFALREPSITMSNEEYLEQLIRFKKRQLFMQQQLMSIYFILLSAGLALYMIEPTMKMHTTGRVIAYAITLAWILFNWFYIRSRTIRKQTKKLTEVITLFENMQNNTA